LYAIITFLPFAWALSASFKTLSEIIVGGINFIPQQFTLDNYKTIFFKEPLFGRWLVNSVFVAVCITGCNLLFNSMAASMVLRLPALAIYAFFNRYFIQGVAFTGSKE
jgi:multiple sugar transport system permease protein